MQLQQKTKGIVGGRDKFFTDEQIEAALIESAGNITKCATILDCSPKTVYNYIGASEALQEVLYHARESRKDKYESKLDELRDEGNVAAVIFFLKTQAKDRGYIERTELDANVSINVGLPDEFNPPTSEDADYDVLDDSGLNE